MDLKLNAQTGVLGALLLWPEELAGQILQRLAPEDFPDPTLRNLFRGARQLWLSKKTVDPVLLVESLGKAYADPVAQIVGMTSTKAHWEQYCRQLRENHQLAEIQSAALAIASQGTGLADARRLLAEASRLLIQDGELREGTYAELMADFVTRQMDPAPPDYLDFGMPALNKRLQIGARRFVILGAESSTGKTALALQLARNIARNGKRVGFFSYETSKEDLADRLAANAALIELNQAKVKKVPPDGLRRAADEADQELPLKIMESSRYTIDDLRAKILAEGFQVVFVDYLQLIPVRARERWQAVTQISMDLHVMAQELGITVIALSQVTPPQKDKKGWRPWISMGDLRESRQLSQDADAILLLDLCDVKDRKSDRVLIIDKNKDGPLGNLVLRFAPQYMRFEPIMPPEDHPYYQVMKFLRQVNQERRAEQAKAEKGDSVQVKFEDYSEDDGDLPF